MTQDQGDGNGDDDTQEVDAEEDRTAITGSAEEGADEQGINRKTSAAAHEGARQDSDQAVLFIIEGTSGHDARHVTAKAENHGDERLAVQASALMARSIRKAARAM